jgi:hypothetical protein
MMSLSSNRLVSFISITAETIQKEFRTKDANSISRKLLLTLKAFLNTVPSGNLEIRMMGPMFSYQTCYKTGSIKMHKMGSNTAGIEKNSYKMVT